MKFKWMLKFTLSLLIVLLVAACGQSESGNGSKSSESPSVSPTASEGTTDNKGADKPFDGRSINVTIANGALGDAYRVLIPEYEKVSGVKVEFETLAETQITQRLTVQFNSKSDNPDVFMYRANNEGPTYYINGWTEPLESYIAKSPEFDMNDFTEAGLYAVKYKGNMMGIPAATAQGVLYYRKDLLEAANIPVPKTITELIEAAKKLHDPKNEVYGFLGRGNEQALVSQIGTFLFTEGGDFLKDGKATINTPEAVRAFSNYGMLLREYGPPGVQTMDWPQTSALFAQGKAAFYVDGSPIHTNFNTKEKSEYWDKIGFSVIPAGAGGVARSYSSVNWSLGMNAYSKNKDVAWDFMNWIMSKENVVKIQQLGVPGTRLSAWENPESNKAFPPELVPVVIETFKNGVGYQQPPVQNIAVARDAVGKVVSAAIEGKDVQKEADKQNAVFQALIDEEQSKK